MLLPAGTQSSNCEEADRIRRIAQKHDSDLKEALLSSTVHRCDAFPFCTGCPATGGCEDEEVLSNT